MCYISILRYVKLVENLPKESPRPNSSPSSLSSVQLSFGMAVIAVPETTGEPRQKANTGGDWWLLLFTSKPCWGWGPNAGCGDDPS